MHNKNILLAFLIGRVEMQNPRIAKEEWAGDDFAEVGGLNILEILRGVYTTRIDFRAL